MNITEMEVTNMGLPGSLEPINRLMDSYSNNTQDRQNLILDQLISNPFDIKLSEPSDTVGNNNKMLNSYLFSLGLKLEDNYEETPLDKIGSELSDEEVIGLGQLVEFYTQIYGTIDGKELLEDLDSYEDTIAYVKDLYNKLTADQIEIFYTKARAAAAEDEVYFPDLDEFLADLE